MVVGTGEHRTVSYIFCPDCGTKVGKIENGVLLIFGRHHGRHHEVALAIADLLSPLDKPKPVALPF